MSRDRLIEELAPLVEAVRTLDLSADDAAAQLSSRFPLASLSGLAVRAADAAATALDFSSSFLSGAVAFEPK